MYPVTDYEIMNSCLNEFKSAIASELLLDNYFDGLISENDVIDKLKYFRSEFKSKRFTNSPADFENGFEEHA